MATPRSLRSFFDSTPPDLLDTALPSLLLLSRANHEQTQADVASLRSRLAEKEEMLSSLFVQQHSGGGGGGSGGGSTGDGASDAQLGASIERGVHEVQLESLQRKNENLNEQNRKLALGLETSEAKSRALMAEVKNMRDRWQGPVATAAREEQEKRYAALESQLKATTSELEVRRTENDRLMLERTSLTTRVRALEPGGGPTTPQQRKEYNSEEVELLRSENEKLLSRLKSFETGNASLNKTVSVLKTVVKTNEQSNVDLQKKNLDLVAGINMLESQYERTQKKNIVLESKNSELEDDKRALEVKLKQLGDNRQFMVETDTQQLEGRNKQLEDGNKNLEARINQLVESKKKVEATNNQLQDRNRHLTDTNIKLLDAKKQLQDDKIRLNNEIADSRVKLVRLEKSGAALNTQRLDLESSNKKLVEENLYLVRKSERQAQKIQDLENEITTLEERSKRMLSEIHTLRQDKNRLNDDLNDLVRQQRNERRASIDREREQRSPHTKINGVNTSTSVKPHESPTSPAMTARGTKRVAEDRDDTTHTPATNTARSSYAIRSIAETPSTQQTTANTQPPSPPQRSLFDRVKQPALSNPECRSLFERINAPSPPSRPQIDREVDELITTSGDSRRGVFCRFHGFQPKVAELLDLISGGPLESVRMALEKDVAFLWFLRPRDAAAFMSYARAHLNGGKMTLPHPGGKTPTPVEFTWNEKPVRALDRDIATNVVRYGASRTFVIHCVPYDISLQKIASDVGGKRFGFWLCEGTGGKVARDGRTQGREVVVEFANVRDAIDARKKLGQDFWCEASWVKEGCDRAVAGSMAPPAGGGGGRAAGAAGATGAAGAAGAAGATGSVGAVGSVGAAVAAVAAGAAEVGGAGGAGGAGGQSVVAR